MLLKGSQSLYSPLQFIVQVSDFTIIRVSPRKQSYSERGKGRMALKTCDEKFCTKCVSKCSFCGKSTTVVRFGQDFYCTYLTSLTSCCSRIQNLPQFGNSKIQVKRNILVCRVDSADVCLNLPCPPVPPVPPSHGGRADEGRSAH